MKEKEIVDFAKTEPDWEEVLRWIVTEEGMDPWDVDIVELANVFSELVKKWDRFNFTVPARLIIIMGILLRLKVELLMWEDPGEKEEEFEIKDLDIDVSDVPYLQAPKKRKPKRKATAEELIEAFRKAFETKERREKKKRRTRKRVKETMPLNESEDIDERIDKLYGRITDILDEMKEGKTKFSSLIPEWNREEIVRSFFPLLHLNQDGKVRAEQEEFFEEIWVEAGERDD